MNIITALMDATTMQEVRSIEKKYREILPTEQKYNLMRWVNRASVRIANVEREKKKSFINLLN